MGDEIILTLPSIHLGTQTGKETITQYTEMKILREATVKHTGGIKRVMFSEKDILVQDCFREEKK